jgi:glutamate racemase
VKAAAPLGVFDSGVGGLSVLREIHSRLPHESLLYVADSAHVPYGSKPPEFIIDRSRTLGKFLLARGAKALVIACNTATAAAAATLRAEWPDVPIIGMEPAVKPALKATRNGTVGVLATVGTLRSAQFAALLGKFAQDQRVITQPAPGLPEAVEAGALTAAATKALVRTAITPLLDAGCDTIVLGCTHYPFLRPLIDELTGPNVVLIDTGAAVARQVEHRLAEAALLVPARAIPPAVEFWTSSDPTQVGPVISRLWGREVSTQALPAAIAKSPPGGPDGLLEP